MKVVSFFQLLDGFVNVLFSTLVSHFFGGVVDMAPSSVPISLDRLRVITHYDSKIFSDATQKVSSYFFKSTIY